MLEIFELDPKDRLIAQLLMSNGIMSADQLRGAVQPLVRTNPRTGRKSLYIASHANRIIGWPVPESRLLLADLMTHATQPEFCHSHAWRDQDLVVWDNLALQHSRETFDPKYRRHLQRLQID